MKQQIQVTVGNQTRNYLLGVSFAEIAADFETAADAPIMLAASGTGLHELGNRLFEDAEIEFLTMASRDGMAVYQRSMTLLLLKAIENIIDRPAALAARVHFSISKGLYVTLETPVDEVLLERITAEMKRLQAACLPITKRLVDIHKAREIFKENEMPAKERLFLYRTESFVRLYELSGYIDYFYGYMLPDTGKLTCFSLHPYDEGFVLQLPSRLNPSELPPFEPADNVFKTMKESLRVGRSVGIASVADLNEQICGADLQGLLLTGEALQDRKIHAIAGEIAANTEKKIVLIAGPSSSGKTTTSHRLAIALQTLGLRPHPIAADNYFVDREQTPLDAEGKLDFECLEAMDLKLFQSQMKSLLNGETVQLPTFNFKEGRKEYNGQVLQLQKGDVLIIEGIHCLNPKLTAGLPQESMYKLYISALTQLGVDEHNRISTTDTRLIRRIIRDARTRGTSAEQTISRWSSVRRGEEKYIFPFQHEADQVMNTSLIYELAVVKTYIIPLLYGIDRSKPEYWEAKRLLKFLSYVVPVSGEMVPRDSILREFIGGGCFDI
ncbi:MAG: nucleoside kinase [Lachnospiraceae bacterium]|nr:nucleoside kinase [Lachnospiraceae bacterium]